MPKPRFSTDQSRRVIFESRVIKDLAASNQEAHRAVIRELKLILDSLLDRIITAHNDSLIEAVEKEIEWRKDQIVIIELDRNAAHNAIKYHTKQLALREGVSG